MIDSFNLLRQYMFALEDVVREVAEKIRAYKGPVQDIKHIRGHEESSLDTLAYEWAMGSLRKNLGRFHDDDQFKGQYLCELHELEDLPPREPTGTAEDKRQVFRIDEIDGTTNTKRNKASKLCYAPNASVSIALCDDESMGSIKLGTVCDLQNMNIFSGMLVDGEYMTFCNRVLLDPKDFEEKHGDTSTRIMVVGYSNRERIKKGHLEQAILEADKTKKDFRIYDGSRSSSIDILNIIRNQFDAYIDPRAIWPDSGAMLYPYDIAGVIPIAYGCGLEISDIYGEPIGNHSGRNEPLHIIIARKGLKDTLVKILEPFLKRDYVE